MLNYISRYTPPVQAQAPKVINSQRGGTLSVSDTLGVMTRCQNLTRELEAAVKAQLDTAEIDRLRGNLEEEARLLPALEIFPGLPYNWLPMIESEIGLPKITPPCE